MWLVVIIAIALNPPARGGPGRASQLFPVDTPAWREADALAELANPNATPLEREVARLRLNPFAIAEPETSARSLPVDLLVSLLDNKDPTLRAGAMRVLQRFAPDDPRYTQAMHPTPSRESLIADLRNPHPERRVAAASYLAEANLLPAPVAAALLRAARAGDFVVREGLVIGIETAWSIGGEVEDALNGVKDRDDDPARRTCAKAALAAIASAR